MGIRTIVIASLIAVPVAINGANSSADDALTGVPNAHPKVLGVNSPSNLSPELTGIVRAQGSTPVENPTASVKYYGYLNDRPNMMPPLGTNAEATKPNPTRTRISYCAIRQARTPTTTTGRISSSRATRPARRAASPASTWTPTPPTVSQ